MMKKKINTKPPVPKSDNDVRAILQILDRGLSVDFTHYKSTTVKRRIIRRMDLLKIKSLRQYAEYLEQNRTELQSLYQDLLINVTSFFRDPELAECLRKKILPKILKKHTSQGPVRIWVPACSTGQEAYTLAMLVTEILGKAAEDGAMQIFASDISDAAVAKARIGCYTAEEVSSVPPKFLARYFNKTDSLYRIEKNIRDMCVFAVHNLSKDPPFSRVDLISCSNLLIYLDTSLQKKVIETFHYALNPGGILVLGRSETAASAGSLFTQIDKHFKIYQAKKEIAVVPEKAGRIHTDIRTLAFTQQRATVKSSIGDTDTEKIVDGILLAKYAPASVLVNQDMEIQLSRGSTGEYLELSPGKASLNLVKMARNGLGFELRNAVHKAKVSGNSVKKTGIKLTRNGASQYVSVEVLPVRSDSREKNFLIMFEDIAPELTGKLVGVSKDKRVQQLEAELKALREDMRNIIESQEATNEELQSANEEVISSNEELQSINEELETSKEEVESANEELVTINQELNVRNDQLIQAQAQLTKFKDELEIKVRDRTAELAQKVEALRLSEERYHNMVAEVKEYAIFQLDVNGTVQTWNLGAERIKGYQANEIIGKNFRIFYTPEERKNKIPEKLLRTALKEGTATHEGWRVRKNGSRFWGNVVITALHNESGKVIGFSKVTRDLTSQKLAEDQLSRSAEELEKKNTELEKANSELASFNFVASHDLQEPLRKIQILTSRILETEKKLTPEGLDRFNRLEHSAQRMQQLIVDLITYSRLDSTEKQFERTDLNEVLDTVKNELSENVKDRNGVIESEHLPAVSGIPFQIQQLFTNLITNALKFTRPGVAPHLKISSRIVEGRSIPSADPKKKYYEIRFKDNGIGFDEKYKDRVFELFQRLHSKDEYPGTGLGLAICKRIAENHNGFITAEGKEGQGAVFHVYLPAN